LMLWGNRHQLLEPGVEAQLGFLYAGYNRDVWWFEMLDMAHKLFLCAMIGFFSWDWQLPSGMVVITVYTMTILLLKPYLRKGDDRLVLLGQVELYLYLLAGYMFHSEISLDYTTDTTLSVFLILLTLGFFLFVVIQSYTVLRKMCHNWRESRRAKRRKQEEERFPTKELVPNRPHEDSDSEGPERETGPEGDEPEQQMSAEMYSNTPRNPQTPPANRTPRVAEQTPRSVPEGGAQVDLPDGDDEDEEDGHSQGPAFHEPEPEPAPRADMDMEESEHEPNEEREDSAGKDEEPKDDDDDKDDGAALRIVWPDEEQAGAGSKDNPPSLEPARD